MTYKNCILNSTDIRLFSTSLSMYVCVSVYQISFVFRRSITNDTSACCLLIRYYISQHSIKKTSIKKAQDIQCKQNIHRVNTLNRRMDLCRRRTRHFEQNTRHERKSCKSNRIIVVRLNVKK